MCYGKHPFDCIVAGSPAPSDTNDARSANQTARVEAEVGEGRGLQRPRPSLPAG